MKDIKLSIIMLLLLIIQGNCFAQVSITYTYDNTDRLTKATYSDGKTILYTYDNLGNRLSMSILIPCQNPDLVISNIAITTYAANKIYYNLTIKNQGLTTANVGASTFAAYNAPSAIRDANAELKSVSSFIGGSISPNATMNINYSSAFNFGNNKYYLILSADNNNAVNECVETNNDLAKLVNPCAATGNLTVSGTYTNEFIATNGVINFNGSNLIGSMTVASAYTMTKTTQNLSSNSVIAIGGCLTVPPVSNTSTANIAVSDNSTISQSPISKMQLADNGILTFDLSKPQSLSFVAYGETEKGLVQTYFENTAYKEQTNKISVDTSKWVRGQKYVLHLKAENSTEVLMVDW